MTPPRSTSSPRPSRRSPQTAPKVRPRVSASAKIRRIALYPGTFDPITNGHLSLVERALGLFDEIIVGMAGNVSKNCLFQFDERHALAKQVFGSMERVKIEVINGLTADYARTRGACAIIRGIRAVSDFEFEFQMALMNRKMARDIETVFLMPSLSWVYLSSTLVKDVATHGGDVSTLVPAVVNAALKKKLRTNQLRTK